jgi:hypothetical protein
MNNGIGSTMVRPTLVSKVFMTKGFKRHVPLNAAMTVQIDVDEKTSVRGDIPM